MFDLNYLQNAECETKNLVWELRDSGAPREDVVAAMVAHEIVDDLLSKYARKLEHSQSFMLVH